MSAVAPQSAAFTRRIRRLVTVEAARSLQPAGLAKGDWKLIAQIIDAELAEEDHTLVEYLS